MHHRLDKKSSFLNNPTYRALFFQILLISMVFWLCQFFFNNAIENLQQQGIASGFGFLDNPAGFNIIMHVIDYSEESTYLRALLVGLLNTLLLSCLAILLATICGFIIGISRLSSNWLVAKFAAIYIEVFRNIPLLLQIFFWYFAILRLLPAPKNSILIFKNCFLNIRGLYLPKLHFAAGSGAILMACFLAIIFSIVWLKLAKIRQHQTGDTIPVLLPCLGSFIFFPGMVILLFTGLPISLEPPVLKGFNFEGGIIIIPELSAMLLALSIYTASFIAEIIRGGILAVPCGQTEAASALGLRPTLILRLIILPQALKTIIPPLTSQYLNLIKNSSLAAAIAYPDLVSVFAGTVLNQTGQAIEVIGITMSIYLFINLIVSLCMNWYNHWILQKGNNA